MTALGPTTAASSDAAIEVPPGHVAVPVRGGLLTAVVGSSVVLCLWDPRVRAGGMSHFLLPLCPAGEPPSPRYGDVATSFLVEKLRAAGAPSSPLVARLYGGAAVLRGLKLPEDRLGARNLAMARITLASVGLSVTAEETGGHVSRRVVFDPCEGSVQVDPIE